MTERNLIGSATATLLSPFLSGWQGMMVWFIVITVLLVVDLRFGCRAARKRGERVRASRAARRTINKFVDYLAWVCVAWVLGASFGTVFAIPLLSAIVMAGVCLIELSSIIGNFLEARGIKKKLNLWKLILKVSHHEELEECLEDTAITSHDADEL